MNNPVNPENINSIYCAIGSALSNWTRVEIQIYQIFGVVHTLTIMQAGGGFSSDMRIPYAALDTIDSFSTKVKMVDNALKSALCDLDAEAQDILSDWGRAKDNIASLTKCRNRLAHWTVGTGFAEGAQIRLMPPPYSTILHKGISVNDIEAWKASFVIAADRLVNIVDRLTTHRGLQEKFTKHTIEQIRVSLPGSSALAELLKKEL